MDVPLVPIGNSRGIRLPKALIAQCGFGDMVSLTVTDAGLLVTHDNSLAVPSLH